MSDINGNELSTKKFLRLDNLSPAVKNLQYAVRGKIVIRAGELEKELKQVSCLSLPDTARAFSLS